MDMTYCITDSCSVSVEFGSRMWGYCRACYRRRFLLAIDPEEYLLAVAGRCNLRGCGVIGDLQLDHDNSCCKKIPSGGRCGACNRGFLCRKHNVNLSWIESIDGWQLLTDTTSAPFVDYLRFWKENPRPAMSKAKPGPYSTKYLTRAENRLKGIGMAYEVQDLLEVDPNFDDPDVCFRLAMENPHA